MSLTPVLIFAMGNQLHFQLDVAKRLGGKKRSTGRNDFLLIVILHFESRGLFVYTHRVSDLLVVFR